MSAPGPTPSAGGSVPSASLAPEYRRDRPRKDPEVEPERPPVDVGEVPLHPPMEVRVVARLHLPETGDPGPHRETPTVPDVVQVDLAGERRSWSDKAHISHQDVPELWQLVD